MNLGRYYHTLRHLRPVQFYGRVVHRLYHPRPDTRPAPALRAVAARYPLPPLRTPSLVGPSRVRFLNVERDISRSDGWNDGACDKLWLYNLHYFDDLNARARDERAGWHAALIRRWVAENPPGRGNGWESYPSSLRIVNWVRWALAGHALPAEAVQSLAVQARFLARRLEYHLLGNHLWANGKALVFAGAFFAGDEAAAWLRTGLGIVVEQLDEQVLSDGGHFERSPMYHAIFLQDLLELLALAQCQPSLFDPALIAEWRHDASAMLQWLAVMTHPDGDIAFFNDAALGIAPRLADLQSQAKVLGLESPEVPAEPLIRLDASGYARMTAGDFALIADVAPVGPDYIPGHAHADTLSFELSWRGQRVFSNSGTSCYGTGTTRQRERSTAAHNTVTIDGQDSSEVWGGFRVARRARPFGLTAETVGGSSAVACSHDGYARLHGRPVHRREWRLSASTLQISDEIGGTGEHQVAGYFHVQPGIAVRRRSGHELELVVPHAGALGVHVEPDVNLDVGDGQQAPEFGIVLPRPVIRWQRAGALPFTTCVGLSA